MVELDGRSGRVLREVRFPVGRPKAIVRLGATLWVGLGAVTADGPGFLAAVDPETGAILRSVPVQHGVAALCAAKGSLWVAHRHRNGVQRLSGTDARPIGERIPVGRDPQAMDYGAGKIWVANRSSNTVSRLDPDIDIADPATIVVGREPRGVLVHCGAGRNAPQLHRQHDHAPRRPHRPADGQVDPRRPQPLRAGSPRQHPAG